MTAKKIYSLKDFHTKSRNETPTKMPLLFDGDDTGVHFLVKGIEARSVADARLDSQIKYAEMVEHVETIKDAKEAKLYQVHKTADIKDSLACALIAGWSFKEECTDEAKIELLQENAGLADSVIAHASTAANYFAKK